MSGFKDQTSNPSPEIFFRAVDRLQLESALTSLRNENKSLVLLSQHKELLDYYGELVVQRVNREFPDTSLEIFLPADTESLLERFNTILNSMSFELATRPPTRGTPDKIWLLKNAGALEEKDLQILLKLLENFPGAGIGALMMFNTSGTSSAGFFDNHPRLNTWALSMPTKEQKLNAIQQARRNGTEEIAIEFFNQLAKAEKKSLTPKPETPNSSKSASKNDAAPEMKVSTSSKQKKRVLPWVIIVAGLLSISVGVSAVLHPEFGEKLLGLFTPKGKNLKAVQSEETLSSAKNDPLSKDVREVPEAALQGQRWLMTLPEDHFVLEFQTFTNVQDAQNEIAGKEWLKRSYIVPVRAEGSSDVKFLIVDGPFRTAEIAKKAASRMPNSSDIVIENVAGLRGYASPQKAKP
jgi:hypothetical protein